MKTIRMRGLDLKTTSAVKRFTAFAENDSQFAPPVLGERDEFPFNFRRQITQHRLIGGMNSQCGRSERKTRGERGDLRHCELSLPLECRQGPGTAGDG